MKPNQNTTKYIQPKLNKKFIGDYILWYEQKISKSHKWVNLLTNYIRLYVTSMIKRIIDFFLFLKGISKTNRQDEVATKGLWAWKHYIGANQRQIKRERESEKRYVHGWGRRKGRPHHIIHVNAIHMDLVSSINKFQKMVFS